MIQVEQLETLSLFQRTDVANVRRGMQYIKPYRDTMRHMDEGQRTPIVIIRPIIDIWCCNYATISVDFLPGNGTIWIKVTRYIRCWSASFIHLHSENAVGIKSTIPGKGFFCVPMSRGAYKIGAFHLRKFQRKRSPENFVTARSLSK